MIDTSDVLADTRDTIPKRHPLTALAVTMALIVGVLARLTVFTWSDVLGPHHPDEHTLPLEALALWEGVTPTEVGWPAATTRVVLSAVAAVQWVVTEGHEAWVRRHAPGEVLNDVTSWIGARYSEPAPLYELGRTVSVVTGILQLLAVIWALRQWTGSTGVWAGLLTASLAPVAVTYSQYVVADITGLFFATVCVGLAAKPDRSRILGMSAMAALAACSKFHFGIWLLAPILAAWLSPGSSPFKRAVLTLWVLAIAAGIFALLVPWALINPLLTAKEFAYVVLAKVGDGATGGIWPNVRRVTGGLGLLALAGAGVGLARLRLTDFSRVAPVLTPMILALAALSFSAIVFDRHGLVLLPGMLVLGAIGWERALAFTRQRPSRWLAIAGFAACAVVTSVSLGGAVRAAAEPDVDTLVKQWILVNVPQGRRVAVHNMMNAFLPRTPEQLLHCAEEVGSAEAFADRWAHLGMTGRTDSQPFRSAIMNDQVFQAFRCRRELQANRPDGYWIVHYHQQPHFGSILEKQAIEEFSGGTTAHSGGIDVLVLNRVLSALPPPAVVLTTRRGQRAIYVGTHESHAAR